MRCSLKVLIVTVAMFAVAGSSASWLPQQAEAGCGITIKGSYLTPVKYGATQLRLRILFGDYHFSGAKSQSRVPGGTWAKLGDSDLKNLLLGQSFISVAQLSLGCNTNHQYRVLVGATDGTKYHYTAYKYFPSSSAYTTNTTIDLGDLGKLFQ